MKTEAGSRSARDVIAVDCASLQVNTANIAELAQGVLALGCPGLNSFGNNVGLRLRVNNVLNNPFSTRKHIG